MVRIVINSKERCGCQQAQFDLPTYDGDELHVGDDFDDIVFENLGPVMVTKRSHFLREKLLIVYCEGTHFLQKLLVTKYPDIEGMPSSAQLPPQYW